MVPALCPGAGNEFPRVHPHSTTAQAGASFSLPAFAFAFPYLVSPVFLVRPQSCVPDLSVTSPSTKWKGPCFSCLLGDPSLFSDLSLEELRTARPEWETMGLPEQDDAPSIPSGHNPGSASWEGRCWGAHPGVCWFTAWLFPSPTLKVESTFGIQDLRLGEED